MYVYVLYNFYGAQLNTAENLAHPNHSQPITGKGSYTQATFIPYNCTTTKNPCTLSDNDEEKAKAMNIIDRQYNSPRRAARTHAKTMNTIDKQIE